MSKKKDTEGMAALIIAFGFVCGSLFLINTFLVKNHFDKKYQPDKIDERVTDPGNILRFLGQLVLCGILAIVGFYALTTSFENIFNKGFNFELLLFGIFGIIVAGLCFLACLAITARIATTQIGMLIDKKKGIFIIPADPNRNSLLDNVLSYKLFTDMYEMEELPIRDIQKITRESCKKAFVHGKFGTRAITWRNKQKRDECIAALGRAAKRNLAGYDRGY